MLRLRNPVRPYAWGSRTAIPELLGQPVPATEPQAELWLGAHPGDPSYVELPGGPQSLLDRIAADPVGELGAGVVAEFGPRLPFLLKVLAADAPLSLQAHPSAAQARAGFAAEEAAGVPRDAPHRNYRDEAHKPELVCALTPFDALCGFREVPATVRLWERLAVPGLAEPLAALRAGDLRAAVTWLLIAADPAAVLPPTVAACARLAAAGGEFAAEARWAVDLARAYPGDLGVVTALLLNLVRLAPGEAVYLPAGNLHAYLRGVAVEVMANSDNVLRGGLTGKHVDVPELLRVLDVSAGPVPVRRAEPAGAEEVFDTPAREFRLSRLRLAGGGPVLLDTAGPQVLLCVAGTARLASGGQRLDLPRGGSAYLAAGEPVLQASGDGVLFRATTAR